MPNIKSAKKRVLVIQKKTLRNQMVKSALKTAIKSYEALVEAGNKAEAAAGLPVVVKKIDQAAAKGVITKNAASRKKSQMALKLNAMA